MPGYPEDRSRHCRRDRRSARDYDDYDDDIYRRPEPKPRDHDDESNRIRRRRNGTYDAGDEEDDAPRHSRRYTNERRSSMEMVSDERDLPPPPIGDDRDEYAKPEKSSHKKTRAGRPPPGAISVPGTDAANGDSATPAPEPGRRRRHGRSPYDDDAKKPPREAGRSPYDDVEAAPGESGRSPRSPVDEDKEPLPPRKSNRRREDLDDLEPPPRRPKERDRDPYEDELSRLIRPVKDQYEEYPPPKASRHSRRPAYDEDSDEYDAPPRRRCDGRDRRRHHDGYGTERPSRAKRDDYDGGYGTDGRDARRDRHADRRAEPRRAPPRRNDFHGDYDDIQDRPRQDRERRGGKKSGGFDDILEKGKKNWEKAAPVARPILTQLANAYIKYV